MAENYKEDLAIDQNALDIEWGRQPLLYAKWAEMAVEAAFQYDKAKERLDVARANLERKIRGNPAEYGIDKITEGAIQSAISSDKDFQVQNENVLDAKRNKGMLDVAATSFDHRKKALENLTSLFLAKYYAEPYVSQSAKKVIEGQSAEGSKQALASSMKHKLSR
jgi:hypothetical protein